MLLLLKERQRRLFLTNEAKTTGFGGIRAVNRISGVFRPKAEAYMKIGEAVPSNDSFCQ